MLVDDQFAPLAPKIEAAVKALQDAPVRFVINTHWHFDHTGGNEPFGKGGALIVAHENVRKRMSTKQFIAAFQREFPPSPAAALPVVTFDDGVTLHWNGEEIAVEHVDARAHRRRRAGLVPQGERGAHRRHLRLGHVPVRGRVERRLARGHDPLGRARARAGRARDTTIIPGHGPLSNAAELRAWREMLMTVRDRVNAALAAGKSLEAPRRSSPSPTSSRATGRAS